MNREKVLELAQQADVWIAGQAPYQEQLERFANLVERTVREQQQKLMEQLIMALKIISIWAKNGSTEKDFDDIAKLANETLEKAKESRKT